MSGLSSIFRIGKTYRNLKRYREILQILFKYGFDDLVRRMKPGRFLKLGLGKVERKEEGEAIEKLTRPERFRMVLEDLGPTFIKMGQILSTRPDLIPWKYTQELTKLQDRVPSFPYDDVREIINKELGDYPETIFRSIEKEPVAAASLAQVHNAELTDGKKVAVKVQRPGIRATIESDLEIMMHLARLIEKHYSDVMVQEPTKIVKEFSRTLEREISYSLERTHIERFAQQFEEEDTIKVPAVYRNYTTEKVITLERIEGVKSSDVETLRRKGYDLRLIARRIADLTMKQLFVQGFFHADPHPANIFILRDNLICYLDFGMMGRLTIDDRENFTELVIHIVKKDEKKLVDAVLTFTDFEEEPNKAELEREFTGFIDHHLYRSMEELELGKMFRDFLKILNDHGLKLKPDIFLMIKALSAVENIGAQLNPEFRIMEHLGPFVEDVHSKRFGPKRLSREIMDYIRDFIRLFKMIPTELRTLIRKIRDGKIRIQFEHRGLESMIKTHDRISNRIAFAIVLASLIVGSSLIVLSGLPPKWHEIPIIGLAGFSVAGIMGFWLLIDIIRSGKMK